MHGRDCIMVHSHSAIEQLIRSFRIKVQLKLIKFLCVSRRDKRTNLSVSNTNGKYVYLIIKNTSFRIWFFVRTEKNDFLNKDVACEAPIRTIGTFMIEKLLIPIYPMTKFEFFKWGQETTPRGHNEAYF